MDQKPLQLEHKSLTQVIAIAAGIVVSLLMASGAFTPPVRGTWLQPMGLFRTLLGAILGLLAVWMVANRPKKSSKKSSVLPWTKLLLAGAGIEMMWLGLNLYFYCADFAQEITLTATAITWIAGLALIFLSLKSPKKRN
jgi:hypothetical protein